MIGTIPDVADIVSNGIIQGLNGTEIVDIKDGISSSKQVKLFISKSYGPQIIKFKSAPTLTYNSYYLIFGYFTFYYNFHFCFK